MFLNKVSYREVLIAPRPTPKTGGPPLVGYPRLLIQFIRRYPPYRRPFLYPQPEDEPCRGDRDPLNGTNIQTSKCNNFDTSYRPQFDQSIQQLTPFRNSMRALFSHCYCNSNVNSNVNFNNPLKTILLCVSL